MWPITIKCRPSFRSRQLVASPTRGNLAAGAWLVYDMDGDSWATASEAPIGTDPLDDCPDNVSDNAWPPDINNDRFVDILGDISVLSGEFGTTVPPSPARHDVAPATPDGFVDIFDITRLAGLFATGCTL